MLSPVKQEKKIAFVLKMKINSPENLRMFQVTNTGISHDLGFGPRAGALLLHLVWHVTVNKLAGDMSLLHQNFSFSVVLQAIQTSNIRIINNKFEYLVV